MAGDSVVIGGDGVEVSADVQVFTAEIIPD